MKNKALLLGGMIIVATVVIIATIPIYTMLLRLTGNFHVVEEGALYRSAQPSEADIKRYAEHWGIRSIINLRDFSPGVGPASDEEGQITRKLGLEYARYPLSASHMLTASQITDVIQMMGRLPRPILVHSYFGADRAGLASALYLYAIDGKSAKEASSQLSSTFGHVPYLGNSTSAMDQTLVAVVNVGLPTTAR